MTDKSTFTCDGNTIIIIPSKILCEKYTIELTEFPVFLAYDNDNNIITETVKTYKLRFPRRLTDPTTPLSTEYYFQEMFVDWVLWEAFKMGCKSIYAILINRAICMNGDTGCLQCTSVENVFVRHSRYEPIPKDLRAKLHSAKKLEAFKSNGIIKNNC